MSKIINLSKLQIKLKKLKKKNKIVLCHGVFDIIHHGHIKYFEEAKKNGDILVVSLTADEFVNKGPGRPYFNFKFRSETLEAIQTIDYICKSNFETSLKVIKSIKPDFYCKGLDYRNKKKDLTKNIFLEKKAVEKNGGKFITTSSKLFSSSNIINSRLDFFSEEQKKSISKIKKISNFNKILTEINNLKNKRILIIGEVIIDEYVFCDALGKSGKEPFLALKKNRVERYLGGSGAIAMHLRDFVKQIDILSYKGESTKDNNFIKSKIGNKIKFHFFNKEGSPTIVKRRYIEENERRKLLGVYTFNDAEINKICEKKILNFLDKKLNNYDCIIVADYGHGLINSKIAQKIVSKAKFCSLNAQINAANIGHHSLEKYKNLDCVIINLNELKHEMRSRNKNFLLIGRKLIKKMNINNLIVTMGRAGAALLNKSRPSYFVAPSFARDIVDKVGAGDCLFALLSLFLSSKINSEVSLFLASIAAGKNVEIVGNSNHLDRVEFLKTVDHSLK